LKDIQKPAAPDFQSLSAGDKVFHLVKPPVTKLQLVRYAGASGDFNPLHTDDEAAREAGFPGVVAHGMLVMAFLAEAVTTWVPRTSFKRIKVRFKGVTRPGDVVTVVGRVREKSVVGGQARVICSIEAVDQNRDVKAVGTFEVVLPL
jgi:acyl dehydratase